MLVILGVACVAIRWSAHKLVVGMAALACYGCMQPNQWEWRCRVIECCREPAIRAVAGTTIRPQLASVSIILGVAAAAFL